MTISIAPVFAEPEPVYVRKVKHEREKWDFYQEPAWAVHALFDAERFVGSIYDPACGEGTICKVARERGFSDVYGSDIVERAPGYEMRDFLGVPRVDEPVNLLDLAAVARGLE